MNRDWTMTQRTCCLLAATAADIVQVKRTRLYVSYSDIECVYDVVGSTYIMPQQQFACDLVANDY